MQYQQTVSWSTRDLLTDKESLKTQKYIIIYHHRAEYTKCTVRTTYSSSSSSRNNVPRLQDRCISKQNPRIISSTSSFVTASHTLTYKTSIIQSHRMGSAIGTSHTNNITNHWQWRGSTVSLSSHLCCCRTKDSGWKIAPVPSAVHRRMEDAGSATSYFRPYGGKITFTQYTVV